LRGVPAGFPARGMALVEAGRWTLTRVLDVRLPTSGTEVTLPPEMTLHIGSARTQARIRTLGSLLPPSPGGPIPPDPPWGETTLPALPPAAAGPSPPALSMVVRLTLR